MTLKFTEWRKSTYSDPDAKCVEVGKSTCEKIGVRDTKTHGSGPIIELTRSEWTSLLNSIKARY